MGAGWNNGGICSGSIDDQYSFLPVPEFQFENVSLTDTEFRLSYSTFLIGYRYTTTKERTTEEFTTEDFSIGTTSPITTSELTTEQTTSEATTAQQTTALRTTSIPERETISSESNFNTRLIIGITVGIIALILICLIIFFVAVMIMKRRKKKEDQQEVQLEDTSNSSNPNIPSGHIKIEEKIGEGSFGEVFKGSWNGTMVFFLPPIFKTFLNFQFFS